MLNVNASESAADHQADGNDRADAQCHRPHQAVLASKAEDQPHGQDYHPQAQRADDARDELKEWITLHLWDAKDADGTNCTEERKGEQ
jgi:hypothetical protein